MSAEAKIQTQTQSETHSRHTQGNNQNTTEKVRNTTQLDCRCPCLSPVCFVSFVLLSCSFPLRSSLVCLCCGFLRFIVRNSTRLSLQVHTRAIDRNQHGYAYGKTQHNTLITSMYDLLLISCSLAYENSARVCFCSAAFCVLFSSINPHPAEEAKYVDTSDVEMKDASIEPSHTQEQSVLLDSASASSSGAVSGHLLTLIRPQRASIQT